MDKIWNILNHILYEGYIHFAYIFLIRRSNHFVEVIISDIFLISIKFKLGYHIYVCDYPPTIWLISDPPLKVLINFRNLKGSKTFSKVISNIWHLRSSLDTSIPHNTTFSNGTNYSNTHREFISTVKKRSMFPKSLYIECDQFSDLRNFNVTFQHN